MTMRKRGMVGLGLAGVLVGCAASQMAGGLGTRKAHAEATTRWEYACFAADPGEKFNDLGRQGWELVGWGGVPPTWCFKRAF
jgi:hypothetical protein